MLVVYSYLGFLITDLPCHVLTLQSAVFII